MARLKFTYIIFSVFLTVLPIKNEIIGNGLFRRPESLEAIHAQVPAVTLDDQAIIKRVVESYRRSADRVENRGNSIWQSFFDQRHARLHEIFVKGNFELVAYVLRNPSTSDLFYGFDALTSSLSPLFSSAAGQQSEANKYLDCLVRFAEAIGAIPLDNPETYYLPSDGAWQADIIVDKIREALGSPILFPNPFQGEHGLLTSYGIMSFRVPQSLYQAYRIKQLLKGVENPRVLEIGAGLGRTAYYARILGINDYTIVDLPFTALSSGYFLGCVLGEEQILYSGEHAQDAHERIKILTPAEFLTSDNKYDLIINADGFTEMDPNTAEAYWKKIEKFTPLFLSINHEVNSYRVKSMINKSSSVVSAERHLYWMRQGYVEEVVRFR